MAKYLGLLSTDMRGKIGGITASRGRSGTTLYAKGVPRRAPSPAQNVQRQVIAQSLYAWRQLTQAQQLSWGAVAANLTWSNSLGSTYVPTGLQLYTQAFSNAAPSGNLPPYTASGSPATVAPITSMYIIASGSAPILVVNPFSGTYTGAFNVYLSAAIPPSLNYTRSVSRRYMGSNLAGNDLFFGAAYYRAYGRDLDAGDVVAVRIVPIDPTYFWSGTVFQSPTTVEL